MAVEEMAAGGQVDRQAIADEVSEYLGRQEQKDLLRFITCGSVDDGKSTLIGRLLFDSHLIYEDQLASLEKDSRSVGTVEDGIDLALLVDGLQAEREQGITIDVAYRFFSTERRKFIVADTPGHEQYTRNMATGASTADLAVILIDARRGVLPQTRRHSTICGLLGIRDIVLAVNKMDLTGFDEARFEQIVREYREFAARVGIEHIQPIPLSAKLGDNVTIPSERTPWYQGPTLLEHLETARISVRTEGPFRLPVQWISRPNADFRGYAGQICGGRVSVGDEVRALPSDRASRVTGIWVGQDAVEEAVSGQSVMITLADEIDISRGDVLVAEAKPPAVADQFAAHLVWMHGEPLYPERHYLLKIGATTVGAAVTELKHKLSVETLDLNAAKTLELNEIGVCNFSLDKAIAFDPYAENRTTGGFILIDRFTNATVGAGMIDFPLRRATNIRWHQMDVDKSVRAQAKGQKPAVLWFTGLSGSGKSTIANLVERKLLALGRHTYLLDGDNVRHGINRDLGFTEADRVENIRRVAEVAKLMTDAGLIVLVSFISPFRSERVMARELMEEGEFQEIFVDAPLAICEERDPKGLYAKARDGQIKNFTGIDSPYEAPENPELVLNNAGETAEANADRVIELLKQQGLLK